MDRLRGILLVPATRVVLAVFADGVEPASIADLADFQRLPVVGIDRQFREILRDEVAQARRELAGPLTVQFEHGKRSEDRQHPPELPRRTFPGPNRILRAEAEWNSPG